MKGKKSCAAQKGKEVDGSLYDEAYKTFEIARNRTVGPVSTFIAKRICSTRGTGLTAKCQISIFREKKI